ncbi:uncharacterized protein TNCV_5012361 [Trichonephila clavipes]|nr:uncharacterized protein TNCV_5012361 [Trichonephila clavipes]
MRKTWRILRGTTSVHGFFFVHDNVHPFTANIVKQFLAKKGLVQIEHPPYSPDLRSPEFLILPRLKLALKGKRFDDIPGIQRKKTSCRVSWTYIADLSSAQLWEVTIPKHS